MFFYNIPAIDFFLVAGIVLLTGLPVGFAVWHVADMIRWRRTDAAELARLSPKPEPAKVTPKAGAR